MHRSILDAIREGDWDYEPIEVGAGAFQATGAMPGTAEKLHVLAERAQRGLPLWHTSDRLNYDDKAED